MQIIKDCHNTMWTFPLKFYSLQIYPLLMYKHLFKRNEVDLQAIRIFSTNFSANIDYKLMDKRLNCKTVQSFCKV